jgi:flagellar hook-length control protein FliK
LTLTTPQLGRVEATLRLEDGGVRIAIAAPGTTGAAALRDAAPDLATALDTAGVPLLGIQIQHGGE